MASVRMELSLYDNCDLCSRSRSQDNRIDAIKVKSGMPTIVCFGTFDERIPHT